MQIAVNNYNAFMLQGCQQFLPATEQWENNASIPFSLTFYDPNGNPLSGLTALSVPAVVGAPTADYAVNLAVGNLTPGTGYQMVLTSTGAYAGYVTVSNTNVTFVTRTS